MGMQGGHLLQAIAIPSMLGVGVVLVCALVPEPATALAWKGSRE
jgi:hypothetical protein